MIQLFADKGALAKTCRAHRINRLSLFGSVLKRRDRPDSDVDLLVEFQRDATPGLFGMAAIETELSTLLGGRKVDLRTAPELSRYFRDEVLRTAEVHVQPEDRVRILHVLDACDSVRQFVTGHRREDLLTDQMFLFALTRAIEVIGEAASRVTDTTRHTLPTVPWSQTAGMRNRLIHAYFDVDTEVLWRTAIEDIPALAAALEHVRKDA